MAIFTRRLLQQLVNENAKLLRPRDTKKIVAHLNRMHKEMTLAPEWEVVIINALSKLGDIGYEMNFGGSANPDIWFRPHADRSQSLAVDITTISDKGFDSNNPIEALQSQVIDRVAAYGLRLNAFHFRVEASEGQKYRTYRRFTKDGRLSDHFTKEERKRI